jgi:hypothetical protein
MCDQKIASAGPDHRVRIGVKRCNKRTDTGIITHRRRRMQRPANG